MIVLDTSFVYALKDSGDAWHPRVARWYASVSDEDFATTPLVLAEVDLLLRSRLGPDGTRALRQDLAHGALVTEWWPAAAVEAAAVAERYSDLGLSLTDASLVVLAARVETDAIATLDERHFRAVRPLTGSPAFRILPADA